MLEIQWVFELLLFAVSGGAWFRTKFSNHKVANGLLGVVAVLSFLFLLGDISSSFTADDIAAAKESFHNGQRASATWFGLLPEQK